MALTPQSIRKGTTISFNGVEVTKEQVIQESNNWDDKQVEFFKKMYKQGGQFKINGILISTKPAETLLTSRGEKDGGIQKVDPLVRF